MGGLLGQNDRPRAAAVWLNWPGLIEAAGPWIDLGVQRALAEKGGDEDPKESHRRSGSVVIEVLKAVRSISSESRLEDDVLVNHTLMEIRDVAK